MSKQIIIDPSSAGSLRRAVEAMGGRLIDLSSTTGVELDPLWASHQRPPTA